MELLADALRNPRVDRLVLGFWARGTTGRGWVGVFGALLGPERTRALCVVSVPESPGCHTASCARLVRWLWVVAGVVV